MWGINPAVIGKILGSVFLTNIVSGTHGAPKIIRDKIVLHVANRDIATAKAMATSVAQQDMNLYDELKRELREKLSEEEWLQIFRTDWLADLPPLPPSCPCGKGGAL